MDGFRNGWNGFDSFLRSLGWIEEEEEGVEDEVEVEVEGMFVDVFEIDLLI